MWKFWYWLSVQWTACFHDDATEEMFEHFQAAYPDIKLYQICNMGAVLTLPSCLSRYGLGNTKFLLVSGILKQIVGQLMFYVIFRL